MVRRSRGAEFARDQEGKMAYSVITVFGGAGFLGRSIVSALARQGAHVRVACRRPDEALRCKPMGDVGQVAPVAARRHEHGIHDEPTHRQLRDREIQHHQKPRLHCRPFSPPDRAPTRRHGCVSPLRLLSRGTAAVN